MGKKYRWRIECQTDAGNFQGSGYSPSRFNSEGFRLAHVFHALTKKIAIEVGEAYCKGESFFNRKALIRKRWGDNTNARVIIRADESSDNGVTHEPV